MTEALTFVKACQDFFMKEPNGKKIEISEFKALSHEDKVQMREMLIAEGYDVLPLASAPPETE